jgi:hypothetical protein
MSRLPDSIRSRAAFLTESAVFLQVVSGPARRHGYDPRNPSTPVPLEGAARPGSRATVLTKDALQRREEMREAARHLLPGIRQAGRANLPNSQRSDRD